MCNEFIWRSNYCITYGISFWLFIISIAPLQVHYYSEALPTTAGYCAGVSRRSAQATVIKGLAQAPRSVDRGRFYIQYNAIEHFYRALTKQLLHESALIL